jgi:HEAT repeat protein
MAALALGDIGRSDAQDELKSLLKDRDPGVRLAAATAVLQLKAAS